MQTKQKTINEEKGWWDTLSKGKRALIVIAIIGIMIGAYYVYDKNNFNDIFNPNSAPEILYAFPGGTIYGNTLTPGQAQERLVTELRAGITDDDGDLLSVTFWVANNTYSWTGIGLFEGYNGTYICQLPTWINLNDKSYVWRVDVNDGIHKVSETYKLNKYG